MHFFTDPNQLPTQTAALAYGPAVADPESEFRLTSQLQLTTPRPAYACQEGQLVIIEATNSTQVTLVLKPVNSNIPGLGPVQYYVYRGVQRASFVTGSTLRARQPAAGNSQALNLFWQSFDAYKRAKRQPSLPDPLPADLVVAAAATNAPIERYFNGQLGGRPLVVKEGNSLGDFVGGLVGFEIITDTYGLTLDLDYFRRASYSVKKTDLDALTGLARLAARDAILSFIDPAAFFGLHVETGMSFGTSATQATGASVVTRAVQPFAPTAHRAYIDIRSELGRSYNFSGRYGNSNNQDLGRNAVFQTYAVAGWPLHYVDLSVAGGTTVQLQLRRDYNDKPQLFCEFCRYGSAKSLLGPRFAPTAALAALSAGSRWTHQLPFYLPGTAATYLKLHYYRAALLPAPPAGVLARRHALDNLFDLSRLPAGGTTGPVAAREPVLVTSLRPGTTDSFTYVAASGVYAEAGRAVFYAQELVGTQKPPQPEFYPPVVNGTTSPGLFTSVQAGFLSTDVALTLTPVAAAATTPPTQVANIYAYAGTPNYRESLYLVSLTTAELQALVAATPAPSPLHPRYLVFSNDTPPGGLLDDTGEPCLKYRVQVQGFDSTGQSILATPSPQVYVYASSDGFMLASPGLAPQAAPAATTYDRDREEAVGVLAYQTNSSTNMEDTFIALATAAAAGVPGGVMSIVTGFETAIQGVTNNDPAGFAQLLTLATNAGRALFAAGVKFVQAGLSASAATNPDDRPIYWARIRMSVALKKHSFFANNANLELDLATKNNSRVKAGSPLAKLVQRFEEASRNYVDASFTAAPAGVKKVFITGYDPFQLQATKQGPYQLNPSGIIAMALHGTTLRNAQGTAVGYVQAMVFPVRFRDFDSSLVANQGQGSGVAEKYIGPFINWADLIVTVSQGLGQVDIEEYATNTRGNTPDNLTETRNSRPITPTDSSGYTSSMPPVPITATQKDNMEWLRTTLDDVKMLRGFDVHTARLHTKYKVEKVRNDASSIVENDVGPPPPAFMNLAPKGRMLEGAGGNFLSNEIFYRVARMRTLLRPTLRTGHYHTPTIKSSKLPNDQPGRAGSDFDFNDNVRNIDPQNPTVKVPVKGVRSVVKDARTILTNAVS